MIIFIENLNMWTYYSLNFSGVDETVNRIYRTIVLLHLIDI